jgi:hypothetical protein
MFQTQTTESTYNAKPCFGAQLENQLQRHHPPPANWRAFAKRRKT